jgi:hypothetical protein
MNCYIPLIDEQQEEIKKLVRGAAKNNRILCSAALAIAKSLGIQSREIGCIVNQLDIKISKCQFDCF